MTARPQGVRRGRPGFFADTPARFVLPPIACRHAIVRLPAHEVSRNSPATAWPDRAGWSLPVPTGPPEDRRARDGAELPRPVARIAGPPPERRPPACLPPQPL